ncbi:metallophosphoesterase [Lacrimispora sp.]|uniref:metallophosphoesterase n=1 Tax=Lacrimispora sp. TaxID=2719234 RepID=UPI002FD920B5
MSRQKKNGLLALIYIGTLLICFGIVLVIGRLHSPAPGGKEPSGSLLEEATESQAETPDREETEKAEDKAEEDEEFGNGEELADKRAETVSKPVMPFPEEGEDQPEAYKPPVIAVITDVHYLSPSLTDYGEAFETMLKKDDGKLVHYIPQLMDAFTADMERLNPSAVVLSGDLTLNGEMESHEALAEKLKILEEKGVKVLVIPGNHDINNYAAASYFGEEKGEAEMTGPEDFYEIYRQFGYDQARSLDEASLSYVYELDEKNWLLMLDSAQYEPVNKVGGRIREETLAWMKEQLEEADREGASLIPIAHHNLLKESILYPVDCTLENSRDVAELLESYHVPLYISGHLHLQRTKRNKLSPGEDESAFRISEVVADAFPIAPCRYGVLKWTENGSLAYETRETDVEGWARQQGILDENLLSFQEYASGFLKEVVSSQIYDQLRNLPEEQMEKMAGLYGDLNRDYCAGIPVDAKAVRSEEAFRLWQRNLPDSQLFAQIDEILRDTGRDHNEWEYEPSLQDISHRDIMVK